MRNKGSIIVLVILAAIFVGLVAPALLGALEVLVKVLGYMFLGPIQ